MFKLKEMLPQFDIDKIKFGVDPQTFERAVTLYESGKVTQFQKDAYGCSAIVLGTSPYHVSVDARHYDRGRCDCYLGQRDILCKHMVAVAIYAVKDGEPLTDKERQQIGGVSCSGRVATLPPGQLAAIKKSITEAMRYIKPYTGPSRTWFVYQNSLCEGVKRLSVIVSELPVSKQTAKLLIDLLLRLDHKLCRSGVDDSDGTVGSFMYELVTILLEFAKLDPACIEAFDKVAQRETCFDWEEPLVRLLDKKPFTFLIRHRFRDNL